VRTIIEASLVLLLAALSTLLIIAVVFPRHVLGGGQHATDSTRIWPAVFVEGTHARPGAGVGSEVPQLSDHNESNICPYLAALVLASKCPATHQIDDRTACPFSPPYPFPMLWVDERSKSRGDQPLRLDS
jgi:hypothetical protein